MAHSSILPCARLVLQEQPCFIDTEGTCVVAALVPALPAHDCTELLSLFIQLDGAADGEDAKWVLL
jgi:hypothetical protein